jgi:RHS repeat-associated protein
MVLDDGDEDWYYAQGIDPNEMQRMAWVAASPTQVPTSGLDLTYDGAGNVKTYGNQVFRYDRVSRVVHHHVGGTSQDYAFDPFGNLTLITTKTFDGQGMETSSSMRSIPVRPTSNQMASGTYDAAGNVLAAGAGALFEWDALSTMTRYANGSVDDSFVYTADGERIAVLHDGTGPAAATWTVRGLGGKVLRQFHPDPSQGLFSDGFEAGNAGCWSSTVGGAAGPIPGSCIELVPVRRYAHRQGKILASVDEQAPGGPTHYYHLNYRNTPNIISDTNGNFDLRVYMAFGEEVTTGGTTFELPHKFTGHERDLGVAFAGSTPGDDDLDYMHARYYWPIFGRFLSVDPSRRGANPKLPQSWNRYAYVLNNPLKLIDPNGEVYRRPENPSPIEAFLTDLLLSDPSIMLPGPGAMTLGPRAGLRAGSSLLSRTPVVGRIIRTLQASRLARTLNRGLTGTKTSARLQGTLEHATDTNKLLHVFDNAEHQLGRLVEDFGSPEAVTGRVVEALGKLRQVNTDSSGVFRAFVRVGDSVLEVRGRVVDGAVRIGTFFVVVGGGA